MIILSKQSPSKNTRQKMIFAIIGIILIGSIIGYYANNQSVASSNKTVAQDIYLVTKHDFDKGFFFAIQNTDDKSIYTYDQISEINVKYAQPISIHIINGDKDERHNFNIDEFNVHTKDLWYFEGDVATFTADKTGTFRYYCSLHPEMTGSFTIS